MGGQVDRHDRNRGDGGDHGSQHNDDEPGGAICGLRRGLGDPHGVDESVRYEEEQLHVLSMVL